MAHHHKVDCLVKKLDCCVAVLVKVTEKVQNSSECSSEQYLLSCWIFCNQTWAKLSYKRLVCCLQVQGHSGLLIWPKYDKFLHAEDHTEQIEAAGGEDHRWRIGRLQSRKMLHHHTRFGYRRFSSWGDIVQMNIQWNYEPFLWLWPWPQQSNPIFS